MSELRDELTQAISAVTDRWDEPLDEVHDIPQIVNAMLAWLAETERDTARSEFAAVRAIVDNLGETNVDEVDPADLYERLSAAIGVTVTGGDES